jgi:hypothetical protein
MYDLRFPHLWLWRPHGGAWYLLHADLFLGLFFDPEDRDDMFLRNVDWLSTECGKYISEYISISGCIVPDAGVTDWAGEPVTLQIHILVVLRSNLDRDIRYYDVCP